MNKNKGQKLVDVRTSYSKAIYSLQAGDINSAYAEVFGLGNLMLIIFLMQHTGPIISHMSNEIANEALNFICTLLPDYDFYGICVSWIQQGMSESDDGSTGPARGAVGKCLGYRGDFT
ncbi:hypothetical protein ARALYDRAFT_913040 [Arabidopsis lyrata subsp. lyrata]|uniref:TORTIFOLIA1/TORL1-2 C-terminal domain-containing protein n=1 Tax=Arabidopsis lyrata subsp. lyrata TaxID=81972 RepID=D7MGG6_ARALL|nr:hypothetical protein ARALYDRAFT_913040 [Arabidopsis lyrata subsp. lyrata]